MGFINPAPPPVDVAEWKRKPHLEKIKPLAQDWAENGFGTPYAVYILYFLKIAGYAAGLLLIGATTPGLGGLSNISTWWTEPIVWQKVVVFTVLWEFLGIGSSSGPLTFRFIPPIGGPLYWLRPGCIRLPPFPDRIPGTAGTRRTWLDVGLAAALYAALFYLLFSSGTAITDSEATGIFDSIAAGKLDPIAVAITLGILGLLGLRDKITFMQTRPDVYAPLMATFLFPLGNMVVAGQFALFFVWFGAASSKLSHHFTYIVQVMISNTPWNRFPAMKRQLYADFPRSLKPSWKAHAAAHLGTFLEFAFPIALLLTAGGTAGTIAIVVGLIFHIHISSTFPLGVPIEWNFFMMFGIVWLFGAYGDVPLSSFDSFPLILLIAFFGVVIPTLGRIFPQKFSFLWAMLYYAGNWATSQWLFRKDGAIEDRVENEITKSSALPAVQLERLYDADFAELTMYKGLAFRSMHSHGRALNGLVPRLVDDVEAYDVREGEFVAGALCGWNFGEGHFHNEQLLGAISEQIPDLEEGDIRIITLESQPILRSRTQRYKLFDVKTGLIEEGVVQVRDLTSREPWTGEIPVEVLSDGRSRGDQVPMPAGTGAA